jgi:hypothetical protein
MSKSLLTLFLTLEANFWRQSLLNFDLVCQGCQSNGPSCPETESAVPTLPVIRGLDAY